MEFNNPFKDLDKKKFKESSSQKNLKKRDSNNTHQKENSIYKNLNNSNIYKSYSEHAENKFNKKLTNNTNLLHDNAELSDEDLFLQSMQSTLKTDLFDSENDKYFIKYQDDTKHKQNKNKSKNQANSLKNSFKEKNLQEENFPTSNTEKQSDSFLSLSSIMDKKLSFKDKNLVLSQDNSKKAIFNGKDKKQDLTTKDTYSQNKIESIITEEDDFLHAMQGVKPINNENIHIPEAENIVIQDPKPLIFDYEEGKLEFSLTQNEEHVQCNILGLDLLILAQLQNRHYNPESYIDLHGFNSRQAFDALIPFFKNAYYKDMRSLLIVTGKGLNSYDGKAFLRSKVCDWLVDNPFKHLVIAFCTAKPQDGGSGALYVLLRKRKKNAKEIPWDRLPNDYDIWADFDK